MYKRAITKKVLSNFDSKEVVFLLGTRQTGKTTLSHLLAQESNFQKHHIWYFDFEDKQYRNMFNDVSVAIIRRSIKFIKVIARSFSSIENCCDRQFFIINPIKVLRFIGREKKSLLD